MITVAELDERIERCLTILADNPHSQVFAALAEAYRRRGDFGRAFSVCKNGLKHHPDYALGHIVMAKLYLHQNMIPEALASLQRAVEINGPTHTTDFLEADLHLSMGDATAAQPAIERLQKAQPSNPAVVTLVRQLRNLRATKPAATEDATATQSTGRTQHRSPTLRQAITNVSDWTEWAAQIGEIRGITGAIALSASGQVLASHAEGEITHAGLEVMGTMYSEIDTLLRDAGWGALEEIRVEVPGMEVWSARYNDRMLGLTGHLQGTFGVVRNRALAMAARAAGTAANSSPYRPKSRILTGHGHKDSPQALTADSPKRDE